VADVFISHSEADSAHAEALAEALEAHGYSTWYYERDGVPIVSYLDQVFQAVKDCKVFALIVSPAALKSHQVDGEVVRAYENNRLFLVLLHGSQFQDISVERPRWQQCIGSSTACSIDTPPTQCQMEGIVRGLRMSGHEPADTAPCPVPNQQPTRPAGSSEHDMLEPIHATIDCPSRGARVCQEIRCSGTASRLCSGHSFALAIEVEKLIYPKEARVIPDQDGNWTATVFEDGEATRFSLSLWLVDPTGRRFISDWLQEGRRTGRYPGLPGMEGAERIARVPDLVLARMTEANV
jgi:TIR domain